MTRGRSGLIDGERLPDSLRKGLAVVFVGTAAGRRSAAVRAYYAHRGNRFWRTLHQVGLSPRQYEPQEFRHLLARGIGFTDMCKRASGMDREIATDQFDVAGFKQKMRRFRPRAIAFTSKNAASLWLDKPTRRIRFGLQEWLLCEFAHVFVLPSPPAQPKATGT